MAEPAYDRSQEMAPPSQEGGRAKPELRLVGAEEVSPEQADSLIDRMVEEFEETADETTKEMAAEAKALDELSEKEGVALTAEESGDNAQLAERTELAAGKLRTEIAAAFGTDVAGLESQLRSLDQELEAAVKGGDGAKVKELEARREQVDAERKQLMAAEAAAKEAPKAPEASVVLDFGQLLGHLPPEAQKAAAKHYAEADEEAYGGIASKGMTPDGVVRLGYKDGTIVEVFPGGETRSNLPGATGAERIPSPTEWMNESEPANDTSFEKTGLLVLEEDLMRDKEELYALESGKAPANDARNAELRARIKEMEATIDRKSTPEGLAKEIEAMKKLVADEEADMNLAPEEERGMFASRIDHWNSQVKELEGRAEAKRTAEAGVEKEKAPEKPPALERKARMLQLESQMRELEQKRKDAATPEAKAEAERALEAATQEWDALRKDWTEEDEKNALEAFEQEAKRQKMLALENRMRDLERQYAEAGSPDAKAAVARELEAATREWDALRKAETGKAEPAAVEQAAALVAAAETIAAAAGAMADTAEKSAEVEKAKEAEKAALAKSPSSIAYGSHEGGSGGGSHGGGGGGGGSHGGKGGESQFWKKAQEEWSYWEKLLGGWAKKG